MPRPKSYTWLYVALIAAAATIIAAIIQSHPFAKNESHAPRYKELNGIIINENSSKGIPNAEVTVIGRNENYVSEQTGNFKIKIMDTVTVVRIRVEKAGFKTFDKSYDLPSDGVIIQLKPQMNENN